MGVISVSAEQVREAVSMPEAIDAVRQAFIDLAAGDFEMPVRTALRDGQFLDMAAHHRPSGTAMFKTLSLNFDGRDPAIVGTVVWSDLERSDVLVADAGAVTALRTGAASGVATDLMAPADARRCVVIGTGAQAADQVRAVRAVRPIDHVTLVGRNLARAEELATSSPTRWATYGSRSCWTSRRPSPRPTWSAVRPPPGSPCSRSTRFRSRSTSTRSDPSGRRCASCRTSSWRRARRHRRPGGDPRGVRGDPARPRGRRDHRRRHGRARGGAHRGRRPDSPDVVQVGRRRRPGLGGGAATGGRVPGLTGTRRVDVG